MSLPNPVFLETFTECVLIAKFKYAIWAKIFSLQKQNKQHKASIKGANVKQNSI